MSLLKKKFRIATRKSPLALAQAELVAQHLKSLYPHLNIELLGLSTEGDRHLSSTLQVVGGKGLFVKELEDALLKHDADIAVHSMKDMTVHYPEGLIVPVLCKRADPRDVFISTKSSDLFSLPAKSTIGTASLRRQCQLLSFRPDLKVESVRGNVNTRLKKLEEGRFDAIILAAAGLERLHFSDRITSFLPIEVSLPAVGQGVIGVQCRAEDKATQELILPLNDPITRCEIEAERAFNARLNGGCRAPIAGFAQAKGDSLFFRGLVGKADGSIILRSQKTGLIQEATQIGEAVANDLLNQGGLALIQEL